LTLSRCNTPFLVRMSPVRPAEADRCGIPLDARVCLDWPRTIEAESPASSGGISSLPDGRIEAPTDRPRQVPALGAGRRPVWRPPGRRRRSMKDHAQPGYYGFKVIGTLKLISGALAVAVGIGLVRFLDHDPGPRTERVVIHLGLDP